MPLKMSGINALAIKIYFAAFAMAFSKPLAN